MPGEMSAMEKARLENIQRNEAFMKSLGLQNKPTAPPRVLNAKIKPPLRAKRKRRGEEEEGVGEEEEGGEGGIKEEPRRSSRNRGGAGGAGAEELVSLGDDKEYEKKTRRSKPDARAYFDSLDMADEEVRVRVVLPQVLRDCVDSGEWGDEISDAAVRHCAMRCSSMSVAALRNRILMIARGSGKPSREKLLLLPYAMRLMGLRGLSSLAQEGLRNKWGIEVVLPDDGEEEGLGVKEEGGVKEEEVGVKEEEAEVKEEDVEVKEEGRRGRSRRGRG
ncbi:hypothetical protein B484DRAFT_57581 [Ochromonadaceae sp. CCMP2298]|nr:hypothetical protein B484DRAFT_57581 [Ochromonadaceae sp. CCMP2298]